MIAYTRLFCIIVVVVALSGCAMKTRNIRIIYEGKGLIIEPGDLSRKDQTKEAKREFRAMRAALRKREKKVRFPTIEDFRHDLAREVPRLHFDRKLFHVEQVPGKPRGYYVLKPGPCPHFPDDAIALASERREKR